MSRKDRKRKMCQNNRKSEIGKKMNCLLVLVVGLPSSWALERRRGIVMTVSAVIDVMVEEAFTPLPPPLFLLRESSNEN